MCLATSLFNLYSIIDTLSEKQQLCTGRSQGNGNLTKVCLASSQLNKHIISPVPSGCQKHGWKKSTTKTKAEGHRGKLKYPPHQGTSSKRKNHIWDTFRGADPLSKKRKKRKNKNKSAVSLSPLLGTALLFQWAFPDNPAEQGERNTRELKRTFWRVSSS